MRSLDVATKAKDAEGISAKRSVVDFPIQSEVEAIKFVGRWLDISKMQVSHPDAIVGPRHTMVDPGGVRNDAVLFASPYSNVRHVLAVTCVTIPRLSSEPEVFLFHGGFDALESMTDPTKKAGFLAFLYPLSEAAKMRERLGSVDYLPNPK